MSMATTHKNIVSRTSLWWVCLAVTWPVVGPGACRKETRAKGGEGASSKAARPASRGAGARLAAQPRSAARARNKEGRGGLSGRVQNGPGGPRSVLIDHPALPRVEDVLSEIRKARALKAAGSTEALVEAALPKLRKWSDMLISYSEQGKRRQADLVASALADLQAHWGDELFPPAKFDAFVRDRFEVRKRVVYAAQFFKPVVYHKDERGAFLKYYRFSVYVKGRIVWRYYVESLEPAKGTETFLLAKVVGRRHIQVADLGKRRPSYWEVRKRVRKDLAQAVAAGRLPLQ